jgi:hypothetical protein
LSTTAGSISGIPMTRSFPAPPVITAIFISWIWKKKHGARGLYKDGAENQSCSFWLKTAEKNQTT